MTCARGKALGDLPTFIREELETVSKLVGASVNQKTDRLQKVHLKT